MNPMHQLTRRPVKAAFGALLLALAGVILALSGGQFWAAVQTRAGVEETYTTVAVVTGGKRQLVSSGDIVYEDIGPTYEANDELGQGGLERDPRSGHHGPCRGVQSEAHAADHILSNGR